MRKKLLQVVLIGICLAFMMCVSYWIGAYHVIYTQELYVTEWKEGENGDFIVWSEIDGQVHEYEVYIY